MGFNALGWAYLGELYAGTTTAAVATVSRIIVNVGNRW